MASEEKLLLFIGALLIIAGVSGMILQLIMGV